MIVIVGVQESSRFGVRDFGRTHSMAIQKRFANFASVWKRCHRLSWKSCTGKIPYAWIGHTPETCLNSADMHHLYNGTFGGRLFPDKGIAIYRIDTDDYSDALIATVSIKNSVAI